MKKHYTTKAAIIEAVRNTDGITVEQISEYLFGIRRTKMQGISFGGNINYLLSIGILIKEDRKPEAALYRLGSDTIHCLNMAEGIIRSADEIVFVKNLIKNDYKRLTHQQKIERLQKAKDKLKKLIDASPWSNPNQARTYLKFL